MNVTSFFFKKMDKNGKLAYFTKKTLDQTDFVRIKERTSLSIIQGGILYALNISGLYKRHRYCQHTR